MDKITERFQQYANRLSDIRVIGQVVFVVIVLLISWSGVKVIHTNYQLQQQIAQMQQQNEIQKLQNENQKLKNDYYNSSQYLELSARENFGLAAPGEKELIVPKDVALAYAPATVSSDGSTPASPRHEIFFVRNMKAWSDFFMHRAATTD